MNSNGVGVIIREIISITMNELHAIIRNFQFRPEVEFISISMTFVVTFVRGYIFFI